jgi:DNA-binding HxlR family transcriptional regulator
VTGISSFTQAARDEAEAYLDAEPPAEIDPRIEPLVNEIIGRVADKWTMLMLEALHENGVMRFSEIGRAVDGISQKMLTQTLRQMEREGLVTRTVYPVVPPRVEYALTDLGRSLGQAFCGVWIWAERHVDEIEAARTAFDARTEEEVAAKR